MKNLKHITKQLVLYIWCPRIFALLVGVGSASVVNGALVLSFIESPGGVQVVGSGSLDTLDGLIFNGPASSFGPSAGYVASNNRAGVVSSSGSFDSYTVASGFAFSAPSGGGFVFQPLPADPGVTFGFDGNNGTVRLPSNYTAGDPVNFSVFAPGYTLALTYGFNDGDSWGASWATGNVDFPTQSIESNATVVPEPAAGFLIVLGMMTVLGCRRSQVSKLG